LFVVGVDHGCVPVLLGVLVADESVGNRLVSLSVLVLHRTAGKHVGFQINVLKSIFEHEVAERGED